MALITPWFWSSETYFGFLASRTILLSHWVYCNLLVQPQEMNTFFTFVTLDLCVNFSISTQQGSSINSWPCLHWWQPLHTDAGLLLQRHCKQQSNGSVFPAAGGSTPNGVCAVCTINGSGPWSQIFLLLPQEASPSAAAPVLSRVTLVTRQDTKEAQI